MKIRIQDVPQATVDTLTSNYGDKWSGAEQTDQSNAFIQFMYSNDLIFVVLGVTLIIWFVLLFFLIKVDRKVSVIEAKLNNSDDHEA
tara:strand:- start:13799 stop:14059 length:261 start_codon:yes stop_codon:yes gene_type:complete